MWTIAGLIVLGAFLVWMIWMSESFTARKRKEMRNSQNEKH